MPYLVLWNYFNVFFLWLSLSFSFPFCHFFSKSRRRWYLQWFVYVCRSFRSRGCGTQSIAGTAIHSRSDITRFSPNFVNKESFLFATATRSTCVYCLLLLLLVPGTDLIGLSLLLILFLFFSCWGDPLHKNPSFRRFKLDRDEIWHDWSSNKYASIQFDLWSRIFGLTSHYQDGGHDVFLRRKVLPSVEYTRSVCLASTTSAGCPLAILTTVPDP